MAITAGNVVWNVLGDTSRLDAAVKRSRTQARGLAQSFMRNSRMIGMGMTAAGGFAVAAAGKIVTDWAKAGDEIAKASKRTGVSTEAMSAFKHAAEQTGAALPDVENGFRRMSRFVIDARDGLSTSTDALDRLGLSVSDLDGLSPQDMFWRLAEAVKGVNDPLEQASLAQDIFGRGGTALLPLIQAGEQAFAQYAQEVRDLNMEFSPEEAAKAEQYTDAMDKLNKAFMGAMIVLGPLIADHLIPLAEWLADNIPRFAEWVKGNDQVSSSIVGVTGVISALLVVLGPIVFAFNQIWTLGGKVISLFLKMVSTGKGVVAFLGGGLTAAFAGAAAAWTAAYISISAEWENVRKLFNDGVAYLQSAFEPLLDYFGNIGEGIRRLFEGDIMGAIRSFGEAFRSYWAGIFGWFGQTLSGIASMIQGLFSGEGIFTGLNNLARFIHGDNAQIASFATGTNFAPGGLAMVGERGRELVSLPRGSQVINNNTTERIMQGGGSPVVNIHVDSPQVMDDRQAQHLADRIGVAVQRNMTGLGVTI